jgi:hypothetical protein
MKSILFPILIVSVLLSACSSKSASYRVINLSDKATYPDYTIEYPSSWSLHERSGHMVLIASDPQLLEGPPPETFTPGQVMVVITVLKAQPSLDSMGASVAVDIGRSRLGGLDMSDPAAMSAYQEGLDPDTGDPSLLILRGMMGPWGKSWAALVAHFAAGEQDKYNDVIFRISKSLNTIP